MMRTTNWKRKRRGGVERNIVATSPLTKVLLEGRHWQSEGRDCVFPAVTGFPSCDLNLVGNVSLELFPPSFHKWWSAKVPSG